MSEFHEQATVIQWANFSMGKYPCLKYLNASLSGVKLSIGQAMKAKRSGLKSGVPDLHLPFNNGEFSSLYIEMKWGKNKPTEDQIDWMKWLTSQGNMCAVCYSAKEAISLMKTYIRKGHGYN